MAAQQHSAFVVHVTHWVTPPAFPTMGSDLLVSSLEKQVLFRKLRHKNAIRRELGIRQFHVPTVFKRKLRLTEIHRYNQLLEPYLVTAFDAADWPAQFTPRLLLAVKLHRAAVDQLYREQCIADPRVKNPDMIAMIERFAPTSVYGTTVLHMDRD